jgi:hypothetical protein
MVESKDGVEQKVREIAAPSLDNSNRARNRTIMITAELTSSVRSQFTEESRDALGFESGAAVLGWSGGTNSFLGGSQGAGGLVEVDASPGWKQATESLGDTGALRMREGAVSREIATQLDIPTWGSPVGDEPAFESHTIAGTAPAPVSDSGSTCSRERIVWRKPSQVVGFLVSYDIDPLGNYFELRHGRLVVTCEGDMPGNYISLDDPSVSHGHAVLRFVEGEPPQIFDQLSENGTIVFRGKSSGMAGEQVVLCGEKSILYDGDTIAFGERKFHLCLVQK